MNVTDAVRQAHSPQAAMLALAEALDRIENKIDSLQTAAPPSPADPWGTWTPVEQADTVVLQPAEPLGPSQDVARAVMVEALEEQLRSETDPEEIQALGARLRLLKDGGAPMGDPVDPTTVHMEYDGDRTIIHLPPADQARVQARFQWAQEHDLPAFMPSGDHAEIVASFAKGGLLWLYHTPDGREALLSMPVLYRQQLVTDLETDSPRLAQEVGRDILASEDSIAPGDAVDAIERLADNISNPAF